MHWSPWMKGRSGGSGWSIPVDMDSHLMQQWLDLVHERNILIRQTNDLSQRMKDLEIEDQLCEIERELRELDQITGVWLLLGCKRRVVG